MPSSMRARVTVSARWAESSRLSSKRRLLSATGLSSVKPLTISISSRSPRYTCSGGTRLFSSWRPSGRSWSELTANSTLPLMPMRPLASVTRPEASGIASAFSSAMRRCSSWRRLAISDSRLVTSSICTMSTPTSTSTNAPSRPDMRSPKTAQTGAVCSRPSPVSLSSVIRPPRPPPCGLRRPAGRAGGAGLRARPVARRC